MSLRRADPRFLLPFAVREAAVLGPLGEWVDGLHRAGVEIVDARTGVELVVAPGSLRDDAVALHPRAVVIEGDAWASSRRAGLVPRRYLARPRRDEPALLLPLEQVGPCRYAVGAWGMAERRWQRGRRFLAPRVLQHVPAGLLPQVVTVGAAPGQPFLVAAAAEHGVPIDAGWVLTLGLGDELSRNVFHLFPRGSTEPAWVLKFPRVEGYSEPFVRDERGLAAAAAAGGAVAAHAPRLLARFSFGGLHASIETAAVGRRLRDVLLESGTSPASRALVEAVAAWTIDMGRSTRAGAGSLADELARLRDEVLPTYAGLGASPELLREVAGLPGALQHNDLGTWNVVVDGAAFVVLDWESARNPGLPLWDLVYFLADALAILDGATVGETRHRHTIQLFRGELASSATLFRWIHRATQELAVPHDAVGPLVTLCWMHHGLSPTLRARSFAAHAHAGPPQRLHGTELNAEAWLADPELGAGWNAWRRTSHDR